MTNNIEWVAVDWGTSNLRLFLMRPDGTVAEQRNSDKGMGTLAPDEFEPTLVAQVEDILEPGRETPIICCGMVGAKQGWQEASYLSVPSQPPKGSAALRVATNDARIAVWILPGMQQVNHPDVMRGEETQIAGFLAANPKFDGVLCLPGTHTKWVRISAEEVVSFQTFMTGELFALLSKQSVLRHSVATDGFDDAAFDAAVSDAMSRPQGVTSKLFALRAGTLVSNLSASQARAQLSGYLIGMELAGARPYWLGMEVAIIGNDALADLYRKGLVAQGGWVTTHDAAGLTLAGLATAYSDIKEKTA
jgi:2-dehydro-3-deoxygalactonokinase